MKKIIVALCILLLVGCSNNFFDKSKLTKNDAQIKIDRVIIDNPQSLKYEVMDYDECAENPEVFHTCKLIVFEDNEAYVIMSYDMAELFKYLADNVETRIDNITDAQLETMNITREELEESIKEMRKY